MFRSALTCVANHSELFWHALTCCDNLLNFQGSFGTNALDSSMMFWNALNMCEDIGMRFNSMDWFEIVVVVCHVLKCFEMLPNTLGCFGMLCDVWKWAGIPCGIFKCSQMHGMVTVSLWIRYGKAVVLLPYRWSAQCWNAGRNLKAALAKRGTPKIFKSCWN